MDIILGVIALIAGAVVIYYSAKDYLEREKKQDIEYQIFEKRRADRQEEFDRHAQAVARREVFNQAVNIHFVGEKRG